MILLLLLLLYDYIYDFAIYVEQSVIGYHEKVSEEQKHKSVPVSKVTPSHSCLSVHGLKGEKLMEIITCMDINYSSRFVYISPWSDQSHEKVAKLWILCSKKYILVVKKKPLWLKKEPWLQPNNQTLNTLPPPLNSRYTSLFLPLRSRLTFRSTCTVRCAQVLLGVPNLKWKHLYGNPEQAHVNSCWRASFCFPLKISTFRL